MMKKLIIAAFFLLALVEINLAQNINWNAIQNDQKNWAYINMGYDFGMTAQLGYSRQVKAFKPIAWSIDYSFPMGKNWTDDFKVRYGGQIALWEKSNFIATAKVLGNFRRHQTGLVRMAAFGTELSAILGYYKPSWHLAGEFGFDKSITNHLKHSDIMRANYPEIKDGWYIPSGGHYFYGIQAGKTLGQSFDLSFRAGWTNAEDKDENAILPYYVQLGLAKRF